MAADNYFHTVGEFDEPDVFEKALCDFEGQVLAIIRGFTNSEFSPSEEDRWAFAHYTALQSERGPDARRTTERLCATMVRLEVAARTSMPDPRQSRIRPDDGATGPNLG